MWRSRMMSGGGRDGKGEDDKVGFYFNYSTNYHAQIPIFKRMMNVLTEIDLGQIGVRI